MALTGAHVISENMGFFFLIPSKNFRADVSGEIVNVCITKQKQMSSREIVFFVRQLAL